MILTVVVHTALVMKYAIVNVILTNGVDHNVVVKTNAKTIIIGVVPVILVPAQLMAVMMTQNVNFMVAQVIMHAQLMVVANVVHIIINK